MADARKIIVYLLAWGIGGVFAYASVLKFMNPAAFLADIESYRLVPYRIAWLGAAQHQARHAEFDAPQQVFLVRIAQVFLVTRRVAAGLADVFAVPAAHAMAGQGAFGHGPQGLAPEVQPQTGGAVGMAGLRIGPGFGDHQVDPLAEFARRQADHDKQQDGNHHCRPAPAVRQAPDHGH